MDELNGTVERITYYNEDNNYSVVKIIPHKDYPLASARDGTVTVVGIMPDLVEGETVDFTGKWVNDPRWGTQFKAETAVPVPPTNTEGMVRYLSSGIVRGIGPRTAEKIVDHFGEETLEILDRNPHRIHEVPRLKTSLADALIESWGANQAMRKVMVFLQGYGVSSRLATRIYNHYGMDTTRIIQDDPYQLADDVFGIGFKKADQIARNMGVEHDARTRLRAGLFYALSHLARDGHTYAPRDLLVETASELLEVADMSLISAVVQGQLVADKLKEETLYDKIGQKIDAVYLPMYYHSERGSARLLKMMADSFSKIVNDHRNTDWLSFLDDLTSKNNVSLSAEQQSAVQAALTSKVSVLTGGPGTGKTTTLQMVIHALEAGSYRFALASPTGRAAKRLSEATERPASTIHRLLGFSPDGGFEFDEDHQLDIDTLIVDEASMIDLILLYNLLKALKPVTHLMLVGDIDQLPSVGAGNVLRDIIDSGVAHVTRLQQIFRQDDSSHIVINAHRVNEGQSPHTDNRSNDFFFFNLTDPSAAAEMIVDVVKNRVREKFGYDPMNDVQVIAPMYRGAAGVDNLNRVLQQALNSDTRLAEYKQFGSVFRVGDKVMQTRNNYDKDVFNGDIGRIHAIDYDDNSLEIVIDDRYIYYDFSETEELIHAYCISTHRSQGSEYPVVVMPILTQHYMMLQRNLLYTAITRARKLVVLVGDRKAMYMAVNNNKVAERYSGLLDRLRV